MSHPDFPLVEGKYQMTQEWFITLDQKHKQRVDEGSLVLWRPGFTIWINVWGNDNDESIAERLKWISAESSSEAFEVNSTKKENTYEYSYRLNEIENGRTTYSYNGYILSNDSYVQITVYFDSENESSRAKSIIESVKYVQP